MNTKLIAEDDNIISITRVELSMGQMASFCLESTESIFFVVRKIHF